MKTTALPVLLALLMLAPTGQALVSGLPSLPLPVQVIGDTIIVQDTTLENESYVVTGRIYVEAGILLRLYRVNIEFAATSPGIELAPTARLEIAESVLRSRVGEAGARGAYAITVPPESPLHVSNTTIGGGQGLLVSSNLTHIRDTRFTNNALGLALRDVELTVSHNTFEANDVAVNQTGGKPRLEFNEFRNGTFCVRNWRANPDIVYNIFDGCKVGILHEQSHSYLGFNYMDDREDPLGTGILVRDTNSPVIEENVISRWGTGILVERARAYIRNNTIQDNVGDGIRIQRNSGVMDIQGNVIAENGGDGIELRDTHAGAPVDVFRNTIRDNGGAGVAAIRSPRLLLVDNVVARNDGTGILLSASPDARVERNTVKGAGEAGIRVTGASERARLVENHVSAPGANGIEIHAASARLTNNTVADAAGTGMVLAARDAAVEGGSVERSGRDGLHLTGADDARVEALRVLLAKEAGARVEDSLNVRMSRVEASESVDGFVFDGSPASVDCVRALRNTNDGLRSTGSPPKVREAWFEDNAGFGVLNLGAAPLDARESYWGSADGPSTPSNPTGGDRVGPNVLYEPFLTSPAACVIEGSLVRIDVSGPDQMVAGSTAPFDVRGFDRYGNLVPLAVEQFNYTAPPSVGVAVARYTESNVTGQQLVNVVAGPLAAIALEGPDVLVVDETATYVLRGSDAHGNDVPLSQSTLTYRAPTTVGPQTLRYEEQGVVGEKTVDVVAGALASIVLDGPTRVDAGTTHTYTATGYDAFGNEVALAQPLVNFTAPKRAAVVDVCAKESGIVGCITVEVVVGPLARIEIVAARSTVNPGRSTTLSLLGYDAADNEVALTSIAWSATAGAIDADGRFTAPSATGPVTIRAASGGLEATAVIDVTVEMDATLVMTPKRATTADALAAGIRGVAIFKDSEGTPASPAYVVAFIERTSDPFATPGRTTRVEGWTDAQGVFRFQVPTEFATAGSYRVRAVANTWELHGAAEATYAVAPA